MASRLTPGLSIAFGCRGLPACVLSSRALSNLPSSMIAVLAAIEPRRSLQQRRALTDKRLANPMAHRGGLVVDRTQSDEPLTGAHRRLAPRRLHPVAPYVGLHMRRRDQFHLVTQRRELRPQ
jgi:hypothetical protein